MTASPRVGALFTDLYEITMAQAYLAEDRTQTAVFEAFFRSLPPGREWILAAGLEDIVDFLEGLRFEKDDLEYLRSLGLFSDAFLRRLAEVRFTGDVWAIPEGSVVFPNEPLVQVVAPVVEAQLAETLVLNQLHLQCVLATKAALVVQAAAGRPVVDFGARRAHGIDAANKLARVSYLAGAAGTSNLLAAHSYGIPAFGTMAHSFIQTFDDELSAFESFARLYPGTTLLVDTYDTLRGVDRVVELARRLGGRFNVRAIRLDSGDLGELSKQARGKLDAAGLSRLQIFASSDLNEDRIAALVSARCPIDGFGVGTHLATSRDAPSLDLAYKLVEYGGRGRTKLSSHKTILPGRKQVFRQDGRRGRFTGDTIARHDETLPGEPLLVPVMRTGKRLLRDAGLASARRRARAQIAAATADHPVQVSPRLMEDLRKLRESLRPA